MHTAPLLRFTQKVVGEIHSILREKYHMAVNPDVPVRYYLTAMRDERLEELQGALGRITRGKYRECEICGGQIPDEWHILSVTAKVCRSCNPAVYPLVYQPGVTGLKVA
ncbi:MAG: hypothetical protein ABI623_01775 [bacterium]